MKGREREREREEMRTVFSPRCWATSSTRRFSRFSTSKAFRIEGRSTRSREESGGGKVISGWEAHRPLQDNLYPCHHHSSIRLNTSVYINLYIFNILLIFFTFTYGKCAQNQKESKANSKHTTIELHIYDGTDNGHNLALWLALGSHSVIAGCRCSKERENEDAFIT